MKEIIAFICMLGIVSMFFYMFHTPEIHTTFEMIGNLFKRINKWRKEKNGSRKNIC